MPLQLSGDIAGLGKIVQIVRATDTTDRSTTSTSFVDAGISVTITPTKNTSAILLIVSYLVQSGTTDNNSHLQITDSSNNAISGAEDIQLADNANRAPVIGIAYATPATTSATTYKTRYKSSNTGTTILQNSLTTGQLYAIEVAA